MARHSELSVERDVLHGLVWSLGGIFALATITFALLTEQQESSLLVAKTERTLASVSEIGELALDAQATARGYMLSGNTDSIRRYTELLPLIDSELNNFRLLCAGNQRQLELADKLQTQIQLMSSRTTELVALRRDEGMEALLVTIREGGGR